MTANQTGGRVSPRDCVLEIDVGDQTEIVSLTETVTVMGSGADCPIRVPDVPEHQAELRLTREGPVLVNVGDPQALAVNGRAVLSETSLTSGDRVRCGGYQLRFRCSSPEVPAVGLAEQGAGRSVGLGELDDAAKPFVAQAILELGLLPRRQLAELLKSTRQERWDGVCLANAILEQYGVGQEKVRALAGKSVRRMGRLLAESVERGSVGYRVKMFVARSLGRWIFVVIVVLLVLGALLLLEYSTGWNLYEALQSWKPA